ncbi:hypothetical protein PHYC_02313 [Phycisphaerales bacterium]|nr:hypothetical protein PHYC_02313 [Phycisphaerales bacterium]
MSPPASSPLAPDIAARWDSLLDHVAGKVRSAGVFAEVTRLEHALEAGAKASAAPASYRLFLDAGRAWVALFTADRYLSQSIEQDLVHTGDKLPELLEEELVDLGFLGLGNPSALLGVEHFRDPQKFFTFRTPLPIDLNQLEKNAQESAAVALLAYEACFRRLGDMETNENQ